MKVTISRPQALASIPSGLGRWQLIARMMRAISSYGPTIRPHEAPDVPVHSAFNRSFNRLTTGDGQSCQ
jgi:hypothetical protein